MPPFKQARYALLGAKHFKLIACPCVPSVPFLETGGEGFNVREGQRSAKWCVGCSDGIVAKKIHFLLSNNGGGEGQREQALFFRKLFVDDWRGDICLPVSVNGGDGGQL